MVVVPGPEPQSNDRAAGIASGAAQRVSSFSGTLPPLRPLAAPDKRCRRTIPASHRRPQPPHVLPGMLRMLPRQGPAHQDARHRFRQVQPRPTQGGVQGGNTALPKPLHQVGAQMSFEIIPDEPHSHWREVLLQQLGILMPVPVRPASAWGRLCRRRWAPGQDGGQLPLQPGMQ